ncbi:MAG: hypothetical protein WAX85_01575 [Minisyncoccia bacterium]
MSQDPVSTQSETAKKKKDPIDVLREHMVGVQAYGYSWMHPSDIVRAIDQAKNGTLGPFKPNFS